MAYDEFGSGGELYLGDDGGCPLDPDGYLGDVCGEPAGVHDSCGDLVDAFGDLFGLRFGYPEEWEEGRVLKGEGKGLVALAF